MTTIAEAKQILYNEFITAFAVAHATTVMILDNEDTAPPSDAAYVEAVVRHTTRNQETLGGTENRKFQSDGIFAVTVYAPLDEGSTTADNLASSVQSIMEAKTFTSGGATVRTLSATLNEVGPTDDGYQIIVAVAFNYYETK